MKEPKPRVTLSEEEVIRRRKAGQRAYYLKHREELLAKRKVSYAEIKLQKGDLRRGNDADDSFAKKRIKWLKSKGMKFQGHIRERVNDKIF